MSLTWDDLEEDSVKLDIIQMLAFWKHEMNMIREQFLVRHKNSFLSQ